MAELSKLEIENNIRERNGLPALTELPKTPEEEQAEREAAEKASLEAKAKEEDEAKKAAEEEAARIAEEKKKEQDKHNEINDDVVLAYLQKTKGLKVSSFDELKPQKTEEEIKAEIEEREANKISWALKNKKFKKEDFENYITAKKDPNSLAIAHYTKQVKSLNPELDEKEITDIVNERFGLDKDVESWQYKQGQQDLALISSQLINSNFRNILSVDNEYSAWESAQNERQSLEAKILANAPAFKKDVEEIISASGSYKTKIGTEDFEVQIPEDYIEKVKNYYLSNQTAPSYISKGWTKENLTEEINNLVYLENRDLINEKIAEQYHKNRVKGTKGIIPTMNRNQPPVFTTDEKLKKAAERHGVTVPTAN